MTTRVGEARASYGEHSARTMTYHDMKKKSHMEIETEIGMEVEMETEIEMRKQQPFAPGRMLKRAKQGLYHIHGPSTTITVAICVRIPFAL